ncbi:MAG: hypothetical protein HY561_02760 [Gemmatimonadetes bacterium]|nr:hypothetical protein [Gemmatimonadota bacterium]
MHTRVVLVLLSGLASVAGDCRPPAPGTQSGGDAVAADSATIPDSAVTSYGDSLQVVLSAPTRVQVGEPVRITLRVRNVGPKRLDLGLLGREIAFDFLVARKDGVVVWRRLEGEMIPAILQLRTLAPGEALELADVWDQRTNQGERVGPGEYTIRGELPTDEPEPLRAGPVRLTITGG